MMQNLKIYSDFLDLVACVINFEFCQLTLYR